jgi:hypothetical protein
MNKLKPWRHEIDKKIKKQKILLFTIVVVVVEIKFFRWLKKLKFMINFFYLIEIHTFFLRNLPNAFDQQQNKIAVSGCQNLIIFLS